MKATKVTAGLAESNGSVLSVLWHDSLHVTCALTACTRDQLRAQHLVTSMGKLYLLPPTLNPGLCSRRVACEGRLLLLQNDIENDDDESA